MRYKRQFFEKIKKISTFYPVIILTGARQTGKTTLLKELYPNYNYVSLDLPSLAEMAENSPDQFLKDNPSPLIIDEVQYAPKLFRHIKCVVDNDRNKMGQYFLTGSQKFVLMKEVGDSLAGRAAWLELESLSLMEMKPILKFKPTRDDLLKIITRGQFPELWRQRDMPSNIFYSTYLATYLERDVRAILNVVALRDFERFMRILAARSGQLLNKTDLAKDVGVSVKAIGDWISVLEASNQIILLEPYFQNISKRAIKNPKVYFNDTGLLSFLLKINEKTILDSPYLGSLWETYIFSEIRKYNRVNENLFNIFYYRDQRAKEIDFFLERGGVVKLVECKWSENPNKKDFLQINKLHKEIIENEDKVLLKNNRNFVISTCENPYMINEQNEAINLNQMKNIWDLP